MGDHWNKSQCVDFNYAAALRLQDRIGSVAFNNDYLLFADWHNQESIPKTMAQPEITSALRCAGHTTIGVEIFTPLHTVVFDSYMNGDISDELMRHYIENQPTNLEADMDIDPETIMAYYASMVENAKSEGLRVVGLGIMQGWVDDPEAFINELELAGDAHVAILKALTREDITEPTSEQIDAAAAEAEITDEWGDITSFKVHTGIIAVESSSVIPDDPHASAEAIYDRLNADDMVANLMEEYKGEGGMTAIYGGLHVYRAIYDIDHVLESRGASASVISIFDQEQNFLENEYPDVRAQFSAMINEAVSSVSPMQLLENTGNYMFDLETNIWTDAENGLKTKLQVPKALNADVTQALPSLTIEAQTATPATPR